MIYLSQMRRYPQYMDFWDSQEITKDQKIDILKGVADILSGKEMNEDARVTNSIRKGCDGTVSFCCTAVPSVSTYSAVFPYQPQ